MAVLLHIAQPSDVEAAQQSGHYHCASLDSEGFIHCCLPEQLQGVVERYYSDASGSLSLLTINADDLKSEPVFENTVGGTELFPHVYGVINMDAVSKIEPLNNGATEK